MKTFLKILFGVQIVLALALFMLTALHIKPIVAYTITYISSSVVFIATSIMILKYDVTLKYVFGLVAVGIILRIAFMPVHPIGSDDYYRYVWDGKVQANGINPYEYSANDKALESLHTETLPKLINYADMKTIYPPLSQIIFYASYLIGGDGFIGLKILLLFFELFTMLGIFLILKKLNLNYKYLLLYALCPLPIFQFFIDAHVDGFGLVFIIFSIFFYIDNKKILSYIFIGLSICIKPLGLIFIPIMFFNEKGFASRIKTFLIPALLCVLLYLPYVFTGSPFQALMKFTENWTFNGVIFDILDSFVHDNQRTRLLCGILLFIFYIPVILSKKDLFDKIYLSIFLLFIFSPIVHPWYLGWLAVLLPFIQRRSGIAYAGLVSLTAFTVLNYQLTGVWKEYNVVLVFEYLPVIFLFVLELITNNRILKGTSSNNDLSAELL